MNTKYKFMKSLREEDLSEMIEDFKKGRNIHSTQYSTCPYDPDSFYKVFHCVMIEYSDNE